ncbi:MAG TPA: ABC transporter permease, partial [Puia sp.]|nr:ABC transporter permease [Puia sp.]
MLLNYFKTAWRHILRGRLYSVLNIMGLAIGMAVALLIGLWVHDQVSYDRWLPGYQQAYQVKYNYNNNGEIRTQAQVCIPLADAMKKDVPEIAYTAFAFGPSQYGSLTDVLEKNGKKLAPTVIIAGEDFLKIFRYRMIEGTADEALRQSGCIVLTASTARALFGNASAINRNLVYNGYSCKVTAVMQDIPRNSSLRFDCITSFRDFASDGWVKAATTNWNHTFFTLYASLKPTVSYEQTAPKIAGLVKKYAPDTYRTFQQQVVMQPLKDWHLYTEYKNGTAAGGLIDYVKMFTITGILVLLIACINFMNLSTARSEKRAKEVGIRKVAGSGRNALIIQFLTESLLLTFIALAISLLFVHWTLPAFNAITGAPIRIPWDNGIFWLLLVGYWLLTGLLSGSRPAFYLSSFQPVKVLKGALRVGASAALPRKILVVLQFTCSIALIIGTIIVYKQIEYARNRPRGYDPNRLVASPSGRINYEAFKREALQERIVSSMTIALSPATDIYSHNTIDNWPGRMPNEPLSLA